MQNQKNQPVKAIPSQKKAEKAISDIFNWMETNYPKISKGLRSEMIIECLLELRQETGRKGVRMKMAG